MNITAESLREELKALTVYFDPNTRSLHLESGKASNVYTLTALSELGYSITVIKCEPQFVRFAEQMGYTFENLKSGDGDDLDKFVASAWSAKKGLVVFMNEADEGNPEISAYGITETNTVSASI